MDHTQVDAQLEAAEYDRLASYADENGLSETEATRRAVRAGLDELDEPNSRLQTPGQMAAVPVGAAVLAAGLVTVKDALFPTVPALGLIVPLAIGIGFIGYGLRPFVVERAVSGGE